MELLADVAEMYYDQGSTQAEIARVIGVTRSAVSRMLKDARERGIVEIQVRRPLRFDVTLEKRLVERFDLREARVLLWNRENEYEELRHRLGRVGAQVLGRLLVPGLTIGVAWGTTISATIEALEPADHPAVKVVQLVGVLGSSSHAFSAQTLVQRLASKVGGEAVYLYTPLIVDSEDMARSLLQNESVREGIEVGKRCDVALLGIGSVHPETCSLYHGGHISRETLDALQRARAVGDVSAYFFDIDGRTPDIDLHQRIVGIPRNDLLHIPTRLGIAGGQTKAQAVLGALRGRYINTLVTDTKTARLVLDIG